MDEPTRLVHMEHGGPVVVGANWYRFRTSEQITHAHVMSVCFLWVVHGLGEIRADGRTHPLEANTLLRLPWGHRVEYLADRRAPFQLGTIHIVPAHRVGGPVVPRVAFLDDDPLLHDPARSGKATAPHVAESTTLTGPGRRIAELGAHAIERFDIEHYDEIAFRLLAELILHESEALSAARPTSTWRPSSFEQMTRFVLDDLSRQVSVNEVADAGGCSATTAQRLFARYTGLSVRAWITERRMAEAGSLLRTTGLRISEVARLVGYADQLYFSRVFRSTYGVPPSQYASGLLRP